METTKNTTTSLQSTLDAKKADFNTSATDEKKKLYAEGIAAVKSSGVETSAKQVGDRAPDFKLKNASNKEVALADYLKDGPVILTWYRGGWCPYCNITLNRLQTELPSFKAEGANLLALTPELPDKSMTTKEKNKLEFEVLSDVGNKIAKAYGVVYRLTKELAESYQTGFDLHAYNGDSSDELPLAATYIINQKGVIVYAFLDAEYRNRAEPKDIIKVLKSLKTK
ncbi:peroxiredoxin-like family protein [Algibacter sp. L4_22]|uniref:peroxiredoxin-like family protein n=1 Tax=Algibacter sp. L4_22 TaxID=2942477 RepID=UPI00201B4B05|nr:peroxiredoxin-like family protein [Algibacter sp. L4_22]MCL5129300.1 AhpC/TSA family protein [Algibacter sp. L4_22]